MLLLVALNSQWVHANLAVRYLAEIAKSRLQKVKFLEFTINDLAEDIVRRLYAEKPEIVAFSCYIWNIDMVLKVASDLKKVLPRVFILLGGPEVSFNAEEVLMENFFVDGVIRGEGEHAFDLFLKAYQKQEDLAEVPQLTYRKGFDIVSNRGPMVVEDLDFVPSPYQELTEDLKGKTIYYETSRGCPFKCAYCLSATTNRVRYFPIARVKEDINRLAAAGVRQVKLVDRTFNSHRKRALELMRFMAALPSTVFHFEVLADLLDEETLEFLSTVPKGKFELEIGIQSTNPRSLKAVNRLQNIEKTLTNTKRIIDYGNIHVHVDLIAGLPYEDYSSFSNSFDSVYNLQAHYFQLGFLKMLKGCPLREESQEYGYVFEDHPPYTVLGNQWLSFEEICKLKIIESLLNRYYNSMAFHYTLKYLVEKVYRGKAFYFFEDLALFWEDKNLAMRAMPRDELYVMLLRFVKEKAPVKSWDGEDVPGKVMSLIVFDYVLNHPNQEIPKELLNPPELVPFSTWPKQLGALPRNEVKAFETLAWERKKRQYRPRLLVFKEDILALAGLQKNQDLPEYPVLFRWEKDQVFVSYLTSGCWSA